MATHDYVNMTRISELDTEEDRAFFAPESMEQHRDRVHDKRIAELIEDVRDPDVREILALMAIRLRGFSN